MAPISWLTETAAAKLLGGLTPEQVQDLVDAGRLHEKWIHDHWAISAESATALLPLDQVADDEDAASASLSAEQPAPSYRGGPRLDPQTEFEYEQEQKR